MFLCAELLRVNLYYGNTRLKKRKKVRVNNAVLTLAARIRVVFFVSARSHVRLPTSEEVFFFRVVLRAEECRKKPNKNTNYLANFDKQRYLR